MKEHLKIWELSLLCAICITLCSGMWAKAEQQDLSSQLVRLHVVGATDSESDQSLKLRVRDEILRHLEPKLEKVSDVKQAQKIIGAELYNIQKIAKATAKSQGKNYTASAKLCHERFPTRNYETFSLPAGEYLSLRVTLGEGAGRNWWCVVFPPLCMTAAADTEAFAGISEESSKLITKDSGEYKLKFHIIEFFEQLRSKLAQ
ncbi:MAG: stage II sporulation protein R [Oscillospiraceae bacterium]